VAVLERLGFSRIAGYYGPAPIAEADETFDDAPRRGAAPSAGGPEGHAAGRSIGLYRHAGRRRPRLDQRQVVRLAALREEPKPVAHHDGAEQQVELVDEVALKGEWAELDSGARAVTNGAGWYWPIRAKVLALAGFRLTRLAYLVPLVLKRISIARSRS